MLPANERFMSDIGRLTVLCADPPHTRLIHTDLWCAANRMRHGRTQFLGKADCRRRSAFTSGSKPRITSSRAPSVVTPQCSAANTCLFVEPNVFHTPAIEEAVGHLREPFDIWLPAGRALGIKEDRPGAIFSQLSLDLPEHLLALRWITLARLPFDQLVNFGIAIAVPIDAGPAAIKYIQDRVGIGPAGLQIERHGEVLPQDPWIILWRVHDFELALNINVLKLVDQQHRRVAERGYVPGGHLDLKRIRSVVAKRLHDLAAFRTVLVDIEPIAGQFVHLFRRHAPQSAGRRLQNTT